MDDQEAEDDDELEGEGEDEYEDAMVELTDEQYRELVAQQNQGNMLIDQQEGAPLTEMQLAQQQQMQQLQEMYGDEEYDDENAQMGMDYDDEEDYDPNQQQQ